MDETIEIDAIETPKGFVPTISGIEQVVNFLTEQLNPLTNTLQSIQKEIKTISTEVSGVKSSIISIENLIGNLGANFGEFLVVSSKINKNITVALEQLEERDDSDYDAHKTTLIELQTILAKMLIQFQNLQVEMQTKVAK